MSTSSPPLDRPVSATEVPAPAAAGRRTVGRLLRSELGMIFKRRRNLVLLAVLALIPVLIGTAIKLSSSPGAGEGPQFIDRIAGNGLFLSLTAMVVVLPLFVPMAGLAAIGLLASTLTEVPVGAMAATLTLSIISQVLDSIPQVSVIHPYLFTHRWLAFGDLLREPVPGGDLLLVLATQAAYVAVFLSLAWSRFSSSDVSA